LGLSLSLLHCPAEVGSMISESHDEAKSRTADYVLCMLILISAVDIGLLVEEYASLLDFGLGYCMNSSPLLESECPPPPTYTACEQGSLPHMETSCTDKTRTKLPRMIDCVECDSMINTMLLIRYRCSQTSHLTPPTENYTIPLSTHPQSFHPRHP